MTSSFKQVLVHLDPSVAAAHRLAVARDLAGRQSSALTALYATSPVPAGFPASPEMGPTVLADLLAIEDQHRVSTRRMFDESQLVTGPAASWSQSGVAPPEVAFAQQALFADLLVVGQHNRDEVVAAGVPSNFPEAVMLASGRPALVVPYVGGPARVGDTVLIAWKPSREASSAVTAALPILQAAARVHVISWGASEAPAVTGACLDLDGYLRLHGVAPTWHREGVEPQQLGETLLSRVFDLGADLLVMGCYGHSRAREWILGGASRTILASMTVPVLMAH